MSKNIIITGGLGYIGSHTILELDNYADEFIIIDNLHNSDIGVLHQLKKISGKKITHYNTSINNEDKLNEIFIKHPPNDVIHFAGLKSVQEGESIPEKYFYCNVAGTVALLNALKNFDCKSLIFSSSATVYGEPEYLPYDENHPTVPINNYCRSKLIAEQIISDWSRVNKISAISLRYFNPVGAHQSGTLGEKPKGIPNNLMPYILEVISGKLDSLSIFGNDYDTKDGTGERDYIHVIDLAQAHAAALKYTEDKYVNDIFNIGTGQSISVMEIINTFSEHLNTRISFNITKRRSGDLPMYFSKTEKAQKYLKWRAKKSLLDMCRDSLRWLQYYNKK